MKKLLLFFITMLAITTTIAQTTEWYYDYDLGSSDEQGKDIIFGSDGNIYAVGTTDNNATNYNIVLISLRKDGSQRW
ncbi:MAG: hypothetical protein EHM44_01025, partial [Ignavibacteriales bacterium]